MQEFEDYLKDEFSKEQPGIDDGLFEIAFTEWLHGLDAAEWLHYGHEFARESVTLAATLSRVKEAGR